MYDENDALKTFCGNLGLLKWSWGWVTSFCQATGAEAIQAFFNLLNKKNVPVILLGPSNTKSLEPIAEAAPKWKLVQVRIFNYLFEITFVAIRKLRPLRYGVISKEKLEKRFPWSISAYADSEWANQIRGRCMQPHVCAGKRSCLTTWKFFCGCTNIKQH